MTPLHDCRDAPRLSLWIVVDAESHGTAIDPYRFSLIGRWIEGAVNLRARR